MNGTGLLKEQELQGVVMWKKEWTTGAWVPEGEKFGEPGRNLVVPGADIGERATESKLQDLAAATTLLEQRISDLERQLEAKTAALARVVRQLELKIDAGF